MAEEWCRPEPPVRAQWFDEDVYYKENLPTYMHQGLFLCGIVGIVTRKEWPDAVELQKGAIVFFGECPHLPYAPLRTIIHYHWGRYTGCAYWCFRKLPVKRLLLDGLGDG